MNTHGSQCSLVSKTFTSRTLKANELNYSTVEKEVLALLRILEVFITMLVTRPLSLDPTFDVGMAGKIFGVASTPRKLGHPLLPVDVGDSEVQERRGPSAGGASGKYNAAGECGLNFVVHCPGEAVKTHGRPTHSNSGTR